jgi:23S rRNA U2552 (ribose-2'-O)-methylase RlmE/FtsJ
MEKQTKTEVIEYFSSNLDVIISDMAANTTGNQSLDSIRTNQLCAEVIYFSKHTLKPKGVLVSKLFMGEDFIEVKNLAKSIFKKVNFFKPDSSRKDSKETYLHCEILKSL